MTIKVNKAVASRLGMKSALTRGVAKCKPRVWSYNNRGVSINPVPTAYYRIVLKEQ